MKGNNCLGLFCTWCSLVKASCLVKSSSCSQKGVVRCCLIKCQPHGPAWSPKTCQRSRSNAQGGMTDCYKWVTSMSKQHWLSVFIIALRHCINNGVRVITRILSWSLYWNRRENHCGVIRTRRSAAHLPAPQSALRETTKRGKSVPICIYMHFL